MKYSVFSIVALVVSSLALGATGGGSWERTVGIEARTRETSADTGRKQKPTGDRKDEDAEPEKKQEDEKPESAGKPTRIAVVVSRNSPVKSLEQQELRRIFLRKKTMWPNRWAVTVYERHSRNPIREQFSKAVLGKKPSELREYWLNLKLTRGLKAPKACRSAKLVKQYLARVKGGIGYMYEREVDETVKVVKIIPIEEAKRD